MIRNKSVLNFERYVVSKIDFETNDSFKWKEKLELSFDFDSQTLIEENRMIIVLNAKVFPEAIKNGYPFQMTVELKGFFSVDVSDLENGIRIFESNAIAILFPYLRSLISSFTANANVPPVLLPAMNINEYLRKKHSND